MPQSEDLLSKFDAFLAKEEEEKIAKGLLPGAPPSLTGAPRPPKPLPSLKAPPSLKQPTEQPSRLKEKPKKFDPLDYVKNLDAFLESETGGGPGFQKVKPIAPIRKPWEKPAPTPRMRPEGPRVKPFKPEDVESKLDMFLQNDDLESKGYKPTGKVTGNTFSERAASWQRSQSKATRKKFGPDDIGIMRHMSSAFMLGATNMIAAMPEYVAIAAKYLEETTGLFVRDDEIEDRALYKLGQAMRKAAHEWFPMNEELADSFLYTVLPQGAGSLAAFMALGVGGKIARLPAWIMPLIGGATMESANMYLEAQEHGATKDEAFGAWLGGHLAGGLEAVPVGRALARFDKISGGGIKKILANGFIGGIEELVQEVAQTMTENYVAHLTFDEQREIMEGTVTAGGAGGILGAVASMMIAAAGLKLHGFKMQTPGRPTEEELEELGKYNPKAKLKWQQFYAAEKALREDHEAGVYTDKEWDEEMGKLQEIYKEEFALSAGARAGGLTTDLIKESSKEKIAERAEELAGRKPETKDKTEDDVIEVISKPQAERDPNKLDKEEVDDEQKSKEAEKGLDDHIEEKEKIDFERIRNANRKDALPDEEVGPEAVDPQAIEDPSLEAGAIPDIEGAPPGPTPVEGKTSAIDASKERAQVMAGGDSEGFARVEYDTLEELRAAARESGESGDNAVAFVDWKNKIVGIPSEPLAEELGLDRQTLIDHEESHLEAVRFIEENYSSAESILESAREGDTNEVSQDTINHIKKYDQLADEGIISMNEATMLEEAVAEELAAQKRAAKEPGVRLDEDLIPTGDIDQDFGFMQVKVTDLLEKTSTEIPDLNVFQAIRDLQELEREAEDLANELGDPQGDYQELTERLTDRIADLTSLTSPPPTGTKIEVDVKLKEGIAREWKVGDTAVYHRAEVEITSIDQDAGTASIERSHRGVAGKMRDTVPLSELRPTKADLKVEDKWKVTGEEWNKVKTGDTVSGLEVGEDIPNVESISASLGQNYEELGIREVPMVAIGDDTSADTIFVAVDDIERSMELAKEIGESGRIDPLIVTIGLDGIPYIEEGLHRYAALAEMGVESFPALVVKEIPAVETGEKAAEMNKPYYIINGDGAVYSMTRAQYRMWLTEGAGGKEVYDPEKFGATRVEKYEKTYTDYDIKSRELDDPDGKSTYSYMTDEVMIDENVISHSDITSSPERFQQELNDLTAKEKELGIYEEGETREERRVKVREQNDLKIKNQKRLAESEDLRTKRMEESEVFIRELALEGRKFTVRKVQKAQEVGHHDYGRRIGAVWGVYENKKLVAHLQGDSTSWEVYEPVKGNKDRLIKKPFRSRREAFHAAVRLLAEPSTEVESEEQIEKRQEATRKRVQTAKDKRRNKLFYVIDPEGQVYAMKRKQYREWLDLGAAGKDNSDFSVISPTNTPKIKYAKHLEKMPEGGDVKAWLEKAIGKPALLHEEATVATYKEELRTLTLEEKKEGWYIAPAPEGIDPGMHVRAYKYYDVGTVEYILTVRGGLEFPRNAKNKLTQEGLDMLLQNTGAKTTARQYHYADPIYVSEEDSEGGGSSGDIEDVGTELISEKILPEGASLVAILTGRVRVIKGEGLRGYPSLELQNEMADEANERLADEQSEAGKKRSEIEDLSEQKGFDLELQDKVNSGYNSAFKAEPEEAVKILSELEVELTDYIDESRERGWDYKDATGYRDTVRELLSVKEASVERAVEEKVEKANEKAAAAAKVEEEAAPQTPDEKINEVFVELAFEQRGDPEARMLDIGMRHAGVWPFVLEHVGDITHRMSEGYANGTSDQGLEYAGDKIDKTHRLLTQGYGFEREFNENMRSNYKVQTEENSWGQEGKRNYFPPDARKSFPAYKAFMKSLGQRYADAHRKLKVYSEPQQWARDAAVAIGEQKWARAIVNLQKLQDLKKDPAAWTKAVRDVKFSESGTPIQIEEERLTLDERQEAEERKILEVLREHWDGQGVPVETVFAYVEGREGGKKEVAKMQRKLEKLLKDGKIRSRIDKIVQGGRKKTKFRKKFYQPPQLAVEMDKADKKSSSEVVQETPGIPPRPSLREPDDTFAESAQGDADRYDVYNKGLDSQVKAFRELYGEVGFQAPMSGLEEAKRYTVYALSARPESKGKWQASFFDKHGPSGHMIYDTWEDGVKELQRDNEVDLSKARVSGQKNKDRTLTDMAGYNVELEAERNRQQDEMNERFKKARAEEEMPRKDPNFDFVDLIVDTESKAAKDPLDLDSRLGQAAYVDEKDGFIKATHITDDEAKLTKVFEEGSTIEQEGRNHELGGGLYVSNVPDVWMSRSSGKYEFLEKLTKEQRAALALAIMKDENMKSDGYLSKAEQHQVMKAMTDLTNGSNTDISWIAGNPFNIQFWKPEFLSAVGIEPSKQPASVEVWIRGKFGEAKYSQLTADEIERMKADGYVGAYTRAGFSSTPQLVVWDRNAVHKFGSYTKGEPKEEVKPSRSEPEFKTPDDIDEGEFLYHGTNAEGAKVIRENGYLGYSKIPTYVTVRRSEAEQYAKSNGGEVFKIKKSEFYKEFENTDHLENLAETGVTTIPEWTGQNVHTFMEGDMGDYRIVKSGSANSPLLTKIWKDGKTKKLRRGTKEYRQAWEDYHASSDQAVEGTEEVGAYKKGDLVRVKGKEVEVTEAYMDGDTEMVSFVSGTPAARSHQSLPQSMVSRSAEGKTLVNKIISNKDSFGGRDDMGGRPLSATTWRPGTYRVENKAGDKIGTIENMDDRKLGSVWAVSLYEGKQVLETERFQFLKDAKRYAQYGGSPSRATPIEGAVEVPEVAVKKAQTPEARAKMEKNLKDVVSPQKTIQGVEDLEKSNKLAKIRGDEGKLRDLQKVKKTGGVIGRKSAEERGKIEKEIAASIKKQKEELNPKERQEQQSMFGKDEKVAEEEEEGTGGTVGGYYAQQTFLEEGPDANVVPNRDNVTPPPPPPPDSPPPPPDDIPPPTGPTDGDSNEDLLEKARDAQIMPEDVKKAREEEDKLTLPERVRKLVVDLQTALTSQYVPLREAQKDIFITAGEPLPTMDAATMAEINSGMDGKAWAEFLPFKSEVIDQIKDNYKDFNTYIFLRRTGDRLKADPVKKKVGSWTVERSERALEAMREEKGDEFMDHFERVAEKYQEHTDRMLDSIFATGIIDADSYEKIKADNDFYALFKVAKHFKDWDNRMDGGGNITNDFKLLHAITGIQDEDVEANQIVDIVGQTAKAIYNTKIRTEKQLFKLYLWEMAAMDTNHKYFVQGRPDQYFIKQFKPAAEILEQVGLQKLAQNRQLIEPQMIKVGFGIEVAEALGIRIDKKRMKNALGMAKGVLDKGGRISLNSFISEVMIHELGHVMDIARIDPKTGETVIKTKNVWGKELEVIQKLSSHINEGGKFQGELQALVKMTKLGGKKKYRHSAVERFAEFMNVYVHNPALAHKIAPQWTLFFETEIMAKNKKISDTVTKLSSFYVKIDALDNINTKLEELGGNSYFETAVRKAFPDSPEFLALSKGTDIPTGFRRILLRVEGKQRALDVREDIYKSLEDLNAYQGAIAVNFFGKAGQILRGGATVYNATFMVKNFIFRDPVRLALLSPYGLNWKYPMDILRFPLDWVEAVRSAWTGNFGSPDALYMRWLKSGAGFTDLQSMMGQGPAGTTLMEIKTKANLLNTIGKFASALEQSTKILGFKRAIRMEKFDSLTPELQKHKLNEIAAEVRRYSGSPDFWRHGAKVKGQASLMFMFLNARIQGVSADLARLGSSSRGYQKEAWANLAVGVGLPTLALALMNYHDDEEREYYEKQNKVERHNYYMIPKGTYYLDDNGEKRQEYWTIPKDDTAKIFSSGVESFVKFWKDEDPAAFSEFFFGFFEDISPIGIGGDTFKERVESGASALNPVLKTPFEWMAGRNFYYHTDIIPRRMENYAPEDQKRSTTPGVFVRVGQMTGTSPLMLEHLVRNITASGLTQFAPLFDLAAGKLKVQEGRGIDTALPVLKMFSSSSYGGTEMQLERLVTIREAEGEDLGKQYWEVEARWNEMQNLKPSQFSREVREIAKTDRVLARAIFKRNKKRNIGWNFMDGMVQSLGVTSGARARYIYAELELMGELEKKFYINELKKKRLLTGQVFRQVKLLQSTGGSRWQLGRRR